MKIKVTGNTATRLVQRLEDCSEYFDNPSNSQAWARNERDALGNLLRPDIPEVERVPFKPGIGKSGSNTVYRNCYGEVLAVIHGPQEVLLVGRRHQTLYGAPAMGSEENPAWNTDVEVLETSRPDLSWWETAT